MGKIGNYGKSRKLWEIGNFGKNRKLWGNGICKFEILMVNGYKIKIDIV